MKRRFPLADVRYDVAKRVCFGSKAVHNLRPRNEHLSPHSSFPGGIWCQNDVVSTLMRCNHVASTLIRRHSAELRTEKVDLVPVVCEDGSQTALNGSAKAPP